LLLLFGIKKIKAFSESVVSDDDWGTRG